MFCHYDHFLVVDVRSISSGPPGSPFCTNPYGKYTTGLLRMASFSRDRIVYQRSMWQNEEGCILANEELVNELDRSLRSYLNTVMGAELYNCSTVELAVAKARIVTKLVKFWRKLRNLW